MPVAIVNQITERVVKGAVNGQDTLKFTALSIVQIGLSAATVDFSQPVDYRLTDGEVDWSPPGREPAVGQSYYVVYTYQAETSFKDFSQISSELEVNMGALQPAATTQPGSVTRNLFVDLPATELAPLYAAAQRVSLIQSLSNLSSFQGTELDDFGANFGVERGPATTAAGSATFTATAIAQAPILVPNGTTISTLSTSTQASVYFTTTADGTIYPGQSSVTIPIECQDSGAAGNVGAGTIVVMNTPVTGISTAYNQNPSSGGTDAESDENYARDIMSTFLANDAVTFRGIRSRALKFTNVIDALVVGAGDPLLVRGGGGGGKVDLYVQAEAGVSRSQTETVTYDGSGSVTLLHQPVISISGVVNDTTTTPLTPSQYQLIKDVTFMAESTGSADAVQIISGAVSGNSLTITYLSNGLLEDIQAFFTTDDANAVPARDFLTRSAATVFINVTTSIALAPGADWTKTQSAVVDAVAGYIDSLTLGAEIKYGTIFNLIEQTTGVDDVLPLTLLAVQGQSTAATIQLTRNQFPVAGTISVHQVS